MPNLTGRLIRSRRMLVVLTLALALLVSPALAQSSARLVAVGDVHGDYDALVSILQQAALIDSKLNWSGKNATLVQTGDLLDRGAKCRQVMDLIMKLEAEAPKSGGRVIVLMGNHEAMNIIGDLRYAEAMYSSFADGNSERRRKAAYDAYAAWRRERTQAGVLPANGGTSDEATWMAAHPLGYVEQREAMSTSGNYGRWLRARPAVAQVGTTLFLHGGISPEVAELARTPDNIVKRVQSEAAQFDHLMRVFVRQKTILPNFDLAETLGAVQAELQFRKKNPGRLTADVASEKRQLDDLVEFTGFNGWFMVNPQGPLWFRGYASWSDEEGKTQIAKVLEKLGVSQIVVGHTPQAGGRIAARFDGKVFLIDTGMLSSYYTGGRASALEIAAGKYTAIYSDERIVLLDSSARHGEAVVPAGHENQSYLYGEVPGGGV
ncbi:MAG TPA: metallophosphoesterase, partial [Candidatus Acidoferrales bacterium]|nr:metallophosphoesterase [Candidatus Acidoferrales bacterium]